MGALNTEPGITRLDLTITKQTMTDLRPADAIAVSKPGMVCRRIGLDVFAVAWRLSSMPVMTRRTGPTHKDKRMCALAITSLRYVIDVTFSHHHSSNNCGLYFDATFTHNVVSVTHFPSAGC